MANTYRVSIWTDTKRGNSTHRAQIAVRSEGRVIFEDVQKCVGGRDQNSYLSGLKSALKFLKIQVKPNDVVVVEVPGVRVQNWLETRKAHEGYSADVAEISMILGGLPAEVKYVVVKNHESVARVLARKEDREKERELKSVDLLLEEFSEE